MLCRMSQLAQTVRAKALWQPRASGIAGTGRLLMELEPGEQRTEWCRRRPWAGPDHHRPGGPARESCLSFAL